MKRRSRLLFVVLASATASCAHTPDVKLNYYLTRSSVTFRVLRTVTCDKADYPVVATSATPTVQHSADRTAEHTILLSGLKGALSDTNAKFEFYDDGRLKSVNTTVTGQGETILKSAFTLATAILGFEGGSVPHPTECAFIKKAGDGKPLTVAYEGKIDLDGELNQAQLIRPDAASSAYADLLHEAIGDVHAYVTQREPPRAPAAYTSKPNEQLLQLRQPGVVTVRVEAGPPGQIADVWSGTVPAGQWGTPYALPLPRGVVFGKQSFALGLSESGALSSVEYGSTTGVGQALNALGAAQSALQGPTAAQKAAELKAEADVIAQQERLVQCKAHRSTCK